jgi:DNA-binding NtrC family response regulator
MHTVRALIGGNSRKVGAEVAQEVGVRWESVTSVSGLLDGIQEQTDVAVLLSLAAEGVHEGVAERVMQAVGRPERMLLSAPGASLELALLARRLGAGMLLREPLDPGELKEELSRLEPLEDGIPLPELPASDRRPRLVGSSEAMARVVRTIASTRGSNAPVLLTGESGTGKELVARAIHAVSERGDGPWVAINCAAIPEHLLESEFFGHERGAFTGAVAAKRGRFERAHGGTLFLDEVGDMSPVLQAKLLRALEEGEIERVGAESPIAVDVRVVAATNQELQAPVAEGRFREDLFYRLAAVRIELPPLRERMDDLEELVLHFTAAFASEYGIPLEGVDRKAVRLLRTHDWPGNVRELRNVVEQGVRMARGAWLRAQDLRIGNDAPRLSARDQRLDSGFPPTRSLEEVEREHIARVLAYTDRAMGEAADILGIHRNTLTRKVDQYGLRE